MHGRLFELSQAVKHDKDCLHNAYPDIRYPDLSVNLIRICQSGRIMQTLIKTSGNKHLSEKDVHERCQITGNRKKERYFRQCVRSYTCVHRAVSLRAN